MALQAVHAPVGELIGGTWPYEPPPPLLAHLIARYGTNISWCDFTFNGWIGCTERGPGCLNCYARDLARGRMGLLGDKDVWGPGRPRRVTKGPWRDVVRWNRIAAADRTSARVFCGSMMDVFDAEAPPARAQLWPLIDACPWIDWLLVTKRPELASAALPRWWAQAQTGPRRVHAWVIASAVTREEVLRHAAPLCDIPAALHGLSLEPLLEDVADALDQVLARHISLRWVIVGGESGALAAVRPFDPAWAARVIEVCRAHGRAPYVKQLGTWWATRHQLVRKADNPAAWPAPLQVQLYPAPRRHAA